MARTSETVTQQEIQAYVKFCKDYNVVNYDGRGPETLANADFALNYFLEVWKQDMTEANFALAFPQLKSHLKFYSSPQHAEYTHVANENIQAAQQLSAWLATQGKPGQLANTGDEAYENLTLLLTELRNRREEVSATTIRNAIDRISHRPGRKLRIMEAPRRTEPVSTAAKNDDGKPFLGSDLVKNPDGSYRSKTPQEQRREAEAAERAKSQPQTRTLDASEQAWKGMADSLLRDGTHSQQTRIRAVYDRELYQGSGWRKIYEACKQETDASIAFRNALKIQEELRQRP
jgi:hypothetical protein